MKTYLRVLGCASAFLAVACSHSQPKPREPKLPDGSRIAVIGMRDCVIAGQDDCGHSGQIATGIFANTLNDGRLQAVTLDRTVGPQEALSDDAAVAYAKSKGYAYVLNGEMTDFYRVAAMTFRKERAAVSLRVIRVADGAVIENYSDDGTANNLSSPEKIVAGFASDVRDDLEDN